MIAPAKKSLGQNFLVDPTVIRRIVEASGAGPGDAVVEIGPGRGALTEGLRGRCGRLVLVEKDDALAAALAQRFAGDPGVTVVHGDALHLPPEAVGEGPVRVVANLPYNVGARITMHLLEDWPGHLRSLTLMFQKEVADRVVAAAGSAAFGALSVFVQSHAEAWPLFGVPPGAFRPIPKVQSAVIRLAPRPTPLHASVPYVDFQRVVKGGFSARRKTLANALDGASIVPGRVRAVLAAAEVDAGLRADAVPVPAWVRLTAAVLEAERGGR